MSSDVLKRAKSLFGLGREPEPAVVPRKKPAQAHHAVAIVPGSRACGEVRKLVGQRFLSSEAPRLPLRNCDRPDCSCRYEHHEDRRRGPRRAREMGVAIDGYEGEEHREKLRRGRRKGDR